MLIKANVCQVPFVFEALFLSIDREFALHHGMLFVQDKSPLTWFPGHAFAGFCPHWSAVVGSNHHSMSPRQNPAFEWPGNDAKSPLL